MANAGTAFGHRGQLPLSWHLLGLHIWDFCLPSRMRGRLGISQPVAYLGCSSGEPTFRAMFTTRHDLAIPDGCILDVSAAPASNTMLERPLRHLRALAANSNSCAPLASLSRTLGLRGGHSAQSVKEDRTGVEFPDTYCHLSRRDCPTLMGTGSAFLAPACVASWPLNGHVSHWKLCTTVPIPENPLPCS